MNKSKRKLTRVLGRLWKRRIKSKLYFEIVILLALISGGVSYAFFSNSVVIPNNGTLPKTMTYLYYCAAPNQQEFYIALAVANKSLTNLVNGGPQEWIKKGRILDNNNQPMFGCEPNVYFENGVFKIWWGRGPPYYQIWYATSNNGYTWQTYGGVLSDPSGYAVGPFMFKEGGVYYLYYTSRDTNNYNDAVHVATSTDGVHFTIYGTVLSRGAGWDSLEIGNMYVMNINGLYYMFYEARSATGYWQIGLATSTNPLGIFNKYGSGPILNRYPQSACHPEIHKIGVTYYMWFHGNKAPSTGLLPSDIYRRDSVDLINWSNEKLVLSRTESFEGAESGLGQVADQCLLEVQVPS